MYGLYQTTATLEYFLNLTQNVSSVWNGPIETHARAREMAQRLGVQALLSEDPGLVLNAKPSSRGSSALFGHPQDLHECGIQTYMLAKHCYI